MVKLLTCIAIFVSMIEPVLADYPCPVGKLCPKYGLGYRETDDEVSLRFFVLMNDGGSKTYVQPQQVVFDGKLLPPTLVGGNPEYWISLPGYTPRHFIDWKDPDGKYPGQIALTYETKYLPFHFAPKAEQ
ncbi:MAG: hypothetical protein ACXVBW_03020 [Bdellovibrionota bacterium]